VIAVPRLLYSVQTAFAAEAWRKRCGPLMHNWIDIAGEAESLLSLATYARLSTWRSPTKSILTG
jgi:hypothetical protein